MLIWRKKSQAYGKRWGLLIVIIVCLLYGLSWSALLMHIFLGGEILSPEEAEGADKDNGKSTPPSLHKYYRWQFAKQT